MGKDAHPHLTPGHGGRLSLLGCACQCISRKPSNRWRCSGLAFHPSHPTALCSFLLTYPPHQTMLPWAPAASPTTLLPAPASSLFPLTPVFLLHLQETELCLCSQTLSLILPNHNCSHFFCTHHHPNTVVFSLTPFLPDLSQSPLFWHKTNLPPPLNLFPCILLSRKRFFPIPQAIRKFGFLQGALIQLFSSLSI